MPNDDSLNRTGFTPCILTAFRGRVPPCRREAIRVVPAGTVGWFDSGRLHLGTRRVGHAGREPRTRRGVVRFPPVPPLEWFGRDRRHMACTKPTPPF
jgi:hypothetical protein